MAKKIKIEIDFSRDNVLLAISCHKKDYWLAYQLNENLKFNLKKMDDLGFYQNNLDEVLYYPIYHYTDPGTMISWYLIGNYHPDGKLFPTLKTADYFILINGEGAIPENDKLIADLKKINGVLHAYVPETKALKDFGNFLADLELHMINS